VCTVCKVVFNGIIHCKACVEAGRISGASTGAPSPAPAAPPATVPAGYSYPYAYPGYAYSYSVPYQAPPHVPETPRPTGTPTRSLYLSGAAGSVIGGIMLLVAGAAMIWGLLMGATNPSDLWIAIAVMVVLAATQFLSAAGLFGFYRNLGVPLGWISAAVLAAGAVAFPLILAFAIPEPVIPYPPGPWNPYQPPVYRFDGLKTYLGAIVLGSGIILEGAAFLGARRYLKDPRGAGTVGGLMIVGGALFAAYLGLLAIGWLLVAIARFIATPVFLAAPVPEKGPEVAPAAEKRAQGSPPPPPPPTGTAFAVGPTAPAASPGNKARAAPPAPPPSRGTAAAVKAK
jgi:hypothetical protein